MIDMKISDIEKVFSGRKPGIIGKHMHFSVLVPLVEIYGEVNLLFEVRASDLKRQPGEICFPGGKVENGETEEACAVRETAEELGISRASVKIISQLDSLYTYSNYTLYSFLGVIEHGTLLEARINSKEVESIFYVPLSKFISTDPFVYKMEIIPDIRDDFPYEMVNFANGYNWRKGISEVPIYQFDGKTIWGLTGRISHNLAKILKEKFL